MFVDYSLYLVTDSSEPILGHKDLVDVVGQAIEGGVTVVQFRDKTSSSKDLQKAAERLHGVTQSLGVPLIINDRVDIALTIGAEGVHLGQDDISVVAARRLLGPNAIIGVTCATAQEAETAVEEGANYLGIGTVFATATKTDTKHIIGTVGVRTVLEHLTTLAGSKQVATVAIGGINASNVQRVTQQCRAPLRGLDGVAVVSAIIAKERPKDAASELKSLLGQPPAFSAERRCEDKLRDVVALVSQPARLAKRVRETGPLSHNMINHVVANFAANVALAVGAKPIMSTDGGEAADLARLGGCLVINTGTVQPHTRKSYIQALQAYNAVGGPTLLDPVGAGATKLRRETVKQLLNEGYFDIIKGNESELEVVYGVNTRQQRGVDSSQSTSTHEEKALLAKQLAKRERNVVVMTGEVDYLSDGRRTYAIKNGHHYLGHVTGTGCTLGTTIASFAAVERHDTLLAAIAAMLLFELAAEHAARKPGVQGPGTFVPALIDSIHEFSLKSEKGDDAWLSKAELEVVDI